MVALLALLPLAASATADTVVGATTGAMDGHIDERLRYRLEVARRDADQRGAVLPVHAQAAIQRFYLERNFAPAWVVGDGAAARALFALLAEAGQHGLRPEDYGLAQLKADFAQRERLALPARVDLELRSSDAALLYASHLQAGRVSPQTVDAEWFVERRGGEIVAPLNAALQGRDPGADLGAAFARWVPRDPRYGRLQSALAAARAQADARPGGSVLPDSPTLRENDSHPAVAALRQRLGPPAAEPGAQALFDAALAEALRAYQARHGLDADGVLGAQTRRALNRSPSALIDLLRVNLERWRWMPEQLEGRRIEVNIPAFTLRALDEGGEALQMPVIVGRAYRRTPVFTGRISYLVLNPYWEVPQSIVHKDLLPKFRQDPGLARSMGFEVLQGWGAAQQQVPEVDWSRYGGERRFPYRLRQRPGPQNAMGRVKFMFPNPHAVYLHDTAHPELFAKSVRTMSSGCVRVADPRALYQWLTGSLEGWPERYDEPLDRSRNLRNPPAVHLQYWTAWVDAEGLLHTRPDVYNRDGPVLEALNAPPPAIAP